VFFKKKRIKKKKDFEELFKNGIRQKGFFLSLRARKNDLEFSRFGTIVSKKVSKKAVERNKIRRRIFEITRKDLLNRIKKGWDVLFVVSAGIKEKKGKELQEILLKELERANLLAK
jgi:ribonuclease P protein component